MLSKTFGIVCGATVGFAPSVAGVTQRTNLLPRSTLETLQALDTDGSGRIEQNEIESFARSAGLDVATAVADFRELDKDGSGELDVTELSGMLTDGAAATETAPVVMAQAAAAPMQMRALPFEVANAPKPLPVAAAPAAVVQTAVPAAALAPRSLVTVAAATPLPERKAEALSPALNMAMRMQENRGNLAQAWVKASQQQQAFAGEDADEDDEESEATTSRDRRIAELEAELRAARSSKTVAVAAAPLAAAVAAAQLATSNLLSAAPLAKPVNAEEVPIAMSATTEQATKDTTELRADLSQAIKETDRDVLMQYQNSSSWLQESALAAERFSAKATAEAFSREAEQVLERQTKDESDAVEFEKLAETLRANASALVRTVKEQTQKAAHDAIQSVTQASLVEVIRMEREAAEAEADARDRRNKATQTMNQAMTAQATLSDNVRRLRLKRHPA